jgi:alkylhydroperoxidase family enzyme
VTRLNDPDPTDIPASVHEFLAFLPPDPMVRMLTHSVATVRPFIELAQILFTSLDLDDRARELVILTVAACAECDFVATQHVPMSAAAGVDARTRELIGAKDLDNPELSPRDRTLVQFAAEVVAHARTSDELFARARECLTERELVEVLQVATYYWSFSRICTVLDVELTTVYGEMPSEERRFDGKHQNS